MDEGDDSKIRRNLVVFSTLIVFVAWLEIPLGLIAAGLLKLGAPPQISPFKLWLTCLLVLLYLTLRYRFTAEWSRIGATYRNNVKHALVNVAEKKTRQSIATFLKTRTEDGNFKGKLLTFYNGAVAFRRQKYGDQISEPAIQVTETSGYSVNRAIVRISLLWEQKMTGISADDFTSLSYEFHWIHFRLLQAYANIHALLYSQSSVQHIVPLLLAAIAFWITAWNLYHSL